MDRKYAALMVFSVLIAGMLCIRMDCSTRDQTERPNILFIIADDLNDNVGGFGEAVQALTPTLDRFRDESVSFTNAHANVALCNPTRASLWSGLYPHTTGFYGYNQHQQEWWNNPVLRDATHVFRYFRENGYRIYGTGKVYHRPGGTLREIDEENFGIMPSFGPFAYNGVSTVSHPALKEPYRNEFALRSFASLADVPRVDADVKAGIPGYNGWWDRGKPFRYENENDRDLMVDEQSAAWASEILNSEHDAPFFLVVGFMRPHRPQIVPKKYFDMYPLDSIRIPPYLENDLDDVPEILWKEIGDEEKNKGYMDFRDLMQAYPDREGWRLWIQSYLACVSYVDEQFGKIMEALDAGPSGHNTIVVFTSDHGYHMGEKDYMFKLTVWDESTRIPLIIRVPGGSGRKGEENHPVSLVDLYPTLIDLAGLGPEPDENSGGPLLDGYSLRPFLEDPGQGAAWNGPPVALSVLYGSGEPGDELHPNEPGKVERQHFTVRSERYRYTLTNKGGEELYDHLNDPHEWYNLADDPEYAGVKSGLRDELLEMTGQKVRTK